MKLRLDDKKIYNTTINTMRQLSKNAMSAAIAATLVFLLAACTMSEAARQAKAVQEAKTARAIAQQLSDRHYEVDFHRAFPSGRGRVIDLTSEYSIKVAGDTLISYLPFFGRAYNVPYGGGHGLNFTGIIRQYDEQFSKKGAHIITMDVVDSEDSYYYMLELFDTGSATLTVRPRERSQISFTGNFHLDEE